MIEILRARILQRHRTIAWPRQEPILPDRFRGRPVLDPAKCAAGCRRCREACPVGAIETESGLRLDMGRCLFCAACAEACPFGAIRFSTDYRLSACRREDLVLDGKMKSCARTLDEQMRRLFGRSLKLRQVSAGGCNACEADVNVLTTVVFDLGRFGIQFVASPRHADGLLVTGPVSKNMEEALVKTYEAVPAPKLVIAVGACAISGGAYRGHPKTCNGVSSVLPVDLFVPGCPPHPMSILEGLVQWLK